MTRLTPENESTLSEDTESEDSGVESSAEQETDQGTVLLIDDDPLLRKALGRQLLRQGYVVLDAEDGPSGLALAESKAVDVALIDHWLPGMTGREVLRRMKEISPSTECVIVTGRGAAELAFQAFNEGACDYFEKPITDWQRFNQVLRRAIEVRRLRADRDRLARRLPGEDLSEWLIGKCPALLELHEKIAGVAGVRVSVLITGESGVGKERVARALHHSSPWSDQPFVAINCAAIPEELLESELFGYEKGGHSTAFQRKEGLFEEAGEGTVMLDEIGEMPIGMQAKLLRVLQEREFTRVGGVRPVELKARIVAATNRDLREEITAKRFREDLFYRLNVFELRVPPLRERIEDIPLLAYYFVNKYNEEYSRDVKRISADAMRLLTEAPWDRNNVRQLENAILRAVVLCATDSIDVQHFDGVELGTGLTLASSTPTDQDAELPSELMGLAYRDAKSLVMERFSRGYLRQRLRESGGNITHAAESSGMERPNFRKLMSKFGVSVPGREK